MTSGQDMEGVYSYQSWSQHGAWQAREGKDRKGSGDKWRGAFSHFFFHNLTTGTVT